MVQDIASLPMQFLVEPPVAQYLKFLEKRKEGVRGREGKNLL